MFRWRGPLLIFYTQRSRHTWRSGEMRSLHQLSVLDFPKVRLFLGRACSALLAICSPAVLGDETDLLTSEKIASLIISSREAVRSGVYETRSEVFKIGSKPQIQTTRRSLYFDETRYRCDSLVPRLSNFSRKIEDTRIISCRNCEGAGNHVAYRTGRTSDGLPLDVYIRDLELVSPFEYPELDMRLIGLFPADTSSLMNFSLSEFSEIVGSSSTVSAVTDNLLITSTNGEIAREILVSPSKGFCVLESKCKYIHEGQQMIELVKTDWVKDEMGDAWIPLHCHFEQRIDDCVVSSEDTEISAQQVNGKLDPAVFSLAGMEIPEGIGITRMVGMEKAVDFFHWTKGRIEKRTSQANHQLVGLNSSAPLKDSVFRRWFVWGNMIIFGIVVSVLIYNRSRRAT